MSLLLKNSEKRPFFIIGCERSGTTLLRVMLSSHPNIAIPYEAIQFSKMLNLKNPWAIQWSRGDYEFAVDRFLAHPFVQDWRISRDQILERLKGKKIIKYKDIIESAYQAYAIKQGKTRWADKTPSNTFDVAMIKREFPNAQFIHIVRDGRDVYLSCKKRWGNQSSRLDIQKAAKKWAGWVWTAYRHTERLGTDRYLLIKYEDLVSDPEKTLMNICAFLGEEYSSCMLEYHKKETWVLKEERQHFELLSRPPEPSRAYVWKKEMSREEVNLFDSAAGSVLHKYGYEISKELIFYSKLKNFVQKWKDRLLTKLIA